MKHSTPESMKFKKLARRLGVSRAVIAGTLELLWIATQNNAKRGDIGRFTNEEIAIECDWDGDPDLLIDSLVDCGWLDRCPEHRLVVHDWPEHAPRYIHAWIKSQNTSFATPTTEATTEAPPVATGEPTTEAPPEGGIRNQTKPNETKRNERGGGNSPAEAGSPPCPELQIVDAFNSTFGMNCRMTTARRKQLQARWRDPDWRNSWHDALQRAGPSEFLRGQNDRGWHIDLEFFLRPDTVTKILEGKYDHRNGTHPVRRSLTAAEQREQANADAFAALEQAIAAEDWPDAEAALQHEESDPVHAPRAGNLDGRAVDLPHTGRESGIAHDRTQQRSVS